MLMGQPRIFFSMARDGLLPPVFGKVHHAFQTPYITTILTGSVAAVIAGLFPIGLLGELVSIGTLLAFVIVCAGVIVLRYRAPTSSGRSGRRSCRSSPSSASSSACFMMAFAAVGYLDPADRLDGDRAGHLLRLRQVALPHSRRPPSRRATEAFRSLPLKRRPESSGRRFAFPDHLARRAAFDYLRRSATPRRDAIAPAGRVLAAGPDRGAVHAHQRRRRRLRLRGRRWPACSPQMGIDGPHRESRRHGPTSFRFLLGDDVDDALRGGRRGARRHRSPDRARHHRRAAPRRARRHGARAHRADRSSSTTTWRARNPPGDDSSSATRRLRDRRAGVRLRPVLGTARSHRPSPRRSTRRSSPTPAASASATRRRAATPSRPSCSPPAWTRRRCTGASTRRSPVGRLRLLRDVLQTLGRGRSARPVVGVDARRRARASTA